MSRPRIAMGKEIHLEDKINAMPMNERDGETILELIRTSVSRTPELIEELFPGKQLVRRRLTKAERTRVASKAAAKASRAAASERHERVVPIIRKVLEDDPSASLAEIKTVLDNSGITPVRSDKWSRATINFIMSKAGIRAKD